MEKRIIEIIEHDFDKQYREKVITHLASITLQDVMAESEQNLLNTRLAVLKLAKGSIDDLDYYIKSAKNDFRDVIYWATQQEE